MSRIKILFIIGVFIFSANQVVALTYKDALPVSSDYNQVSPSNISAAKLLQDYIENYKEKINNLLDSYDSENTEIIQAVNQTLKKMSRSLDAIQYKSINPDVVNEVMQGIVTDLKIINNRMKIYLEQEKQLHKKRLWDAQNNYHKIGVKISIILDELVRTLSESMVQKSSLSQAEKDVVGSLVIIRQQSNKIKDFKNISFDSEQEMKEYFKNIISTIKREITRMKNISS